jgi:hypothetical protein
MYVNDAGALRLIRQCFVNDAGVLRNMQRLSINDAGTLRHVFFGLVTVSGETISDINVAFVSFATVRFKSTGIVQKDTNAGSNVQIDSGTDWIIPNASAAGGYEIRATATGPSGSGSLTGSALNTWLSLASDREWTLTVIGDESSTTTLLIEIRQGSTVLSSGSYVLNVDGIPL